MRGWFAAALVLATSGEMVAPAWAQQGRLIPHAQDRPPGPALSPTEAIARMTVPEGFRVELVASEPDIVNPVAMTFDERGRVWITESLEYPRRSPGPGRDRVKVLEDTDGDGRADKFTLFADGLNIPSGIAVGAGGVWVANSPDILFLKDTDGDGRADTREVVVTGFGREDTHELPNSLTWGPDGYLYGWNGVFNPAMIDYRGKRYEFTCAIFRIDPKTRDFEVFCEGTSNPWGIAWDKEGSAFASACVIDHLWHLTETGYYHRQGGPYPPFTWKLESIVDHKHQKAAYCGITYFDSDAYPAKYRDRLFMGNIHGNGINVDKLSRNGATYRGTTEADFLQANDAWFMPVVQKVGPDGSLYVLDWYDRYHCYQDANRDPNGIDRLKGRLYRVRYQDTPRPAKFDLAAESDDQLIARLSSPNIYLRETAQRLLRERDHAEARGKLQSLVLDEKADRRGRLHALWTLVGTGRLDADFHLRLLGETDPTFRAWGVRAAGNFRKVAPEVRDRVVGLVEDPSPEVRVQVAIASRKIEGVDPLPILTRLVESSGDDFLIAPIVWQNLHPLLDDRGADFVRFVSKIDLGRSPRMASLVPRAVDRLLGGANFQPEAAVALLAPLLAIKGDRVAEVDRKGIVESRERTFQALAGRVRQGATSEARRSRLVECLKPALAPSLVSKPGGSYPFEIVLLAVGWNDPTAVAVARDFLVAGTISEGLWARLLDALASVQDPPTLDLIPPFLEEEDETRVPARLRGEILAALGKYESPRVAPIVLRAYPGLDLGLRPKAIEILAQRPMWAAPLLDAVDRKVVPASAFNLNQVRKLVGSRDAAIAARSRAIWGTVREGRNPAREQLIESIRVKLKDAKGDPAAGVVVFRNVCGQCHKIYGEGQEVGPEVTLNGRGSYDQLLSNVLDPNLVIGPGYQASTIATTDGRVLTGLIVEDSPQRIVLKLQGGKIETVARSAVEESKLSPLSLMPEGLENQVTPKELADLFAFLTLDKPPGDPATRPIPGTPPGIRR